mgnify:CR=1 FL=1
MLLLILVPGSDNSSTEYRHDKNYITCAEIDMWESVEVSRFTESQLRIEFYDIKVRARELMRSI